MPKVRMPKAKMTYPEPTPTMREIRAKAKELGIEVDDSAYSNQWFIITFAKTADTYNVHFKGRKRNARDKRAAMAAIEAWGKP
mgnify:CR=1 FL=1